MSDVAAPSGAKKAPQAGDVSGAVVPESDGVELLPGEGVTKTIIKTRVRIECAYCGEPADERHTYLLPNARTNPQSNAYGGDDISWCCDREEFTCKSCRDGNWRGQEPPVDGFRWCSTFGLSKRFAHMFLKWHEREVTPTAPPQESTAPASSPVPEVTGA